VVLDVDVHQRLVSLGVEQLAEAVAKLVRQVRVWTIERVGIVEGGELVVEHNQIEETHKRPEIARNCLPSIRACLFSLQEELAGPEYERIDDQVQLSPCELVPVLQPSNDQVVVPTPVLARAD
jgi:hypothetical protein